MEDPWGSPWAADDVSTTPKIDLPTAPPRVVANSADRDPRGGTLWTENNRGFDDNDDDNAWGGWNDATVAGANSPGWGHSPGLRPVPAAASRDPSPGPWDKRRNEEKIFDSAISLGGKDEIGTGLGAELAPAPAIVDAPEDVWQTDILAPVPDQTTPASPVVLETSPTRPDSPDIPPPGPALRIGELPEPVQRQGSKVQELVVMYDGIAKRSVSPPSPELAPPPPRKIRAAADDGSEDESSDSEAESSVDSPQEKLPEAPASEPSQDHIPPAGGALVEETAVEAIVGDELESAPRSRLQPPKIPIDLSKLDALFPTTPAPNTEPEPLPDTIIDDTFASNSERRTWYRISRFGSKRKHDTGNDDNYVRMDWAHSTARVDTLKIVRRWMEQDSIAGRVALGGWHRGAAGASMFGWDTEAPAVEIGELFGRRKKLQTGGAHSRGASGSSKASKSSPTVATFGWSSPAASPTVATFPKAAPEAHQAKPPSVAPTSRPKSSIMPPAVGSVASPVQLKQRPRSLIIPAAEAMAPPSIDQALSASIASPTMAPPPPPPAAQACMNGDEDDDDDWGEMVSSPTVPTSGAFQSSIPQVDTGAAVPSLPEVLSPEKQTIPQQQAPKDASARKLEPVPDPWGIGNVESLARGIQAKASSPTALASADQPVPEDAQSKITTSTSTSILQPLPSPSLPSPNTHISPPEAPKDAPSKVTTSPPTLASQPLSSPSLPSPNTHISPPGLCLDDKDEETAMQILNDLSDLSYMLR